jgi:hypothetical protein
MILKTVALMLLVAPAYAGSWNVDMNHLLSAAMIDDGVMLQHKMETSVSPFARGPQLEFILANDLYRQRVTQASAGSGIGLRQELGDDLAVSARALSIGYPWGPLAMEAALSWRFWTAEPIGTHVPIGLEWTVYAGSAPRAGNPLSWTGSGIALAFGY